MSAKTHNIGFAVDEELHARLRELQRVLPEYGKVSFSELCRVVLKHGCDELERFVVVRELPKMVAGAGLLGGDGAPRVLRAGRKVHWFNMRQTKEIHYGGLSTDYAAWIRDLQRHFVPGTFDYVLIYCVSGCKECLPMQRVPTQP